MGLSLNMPSTTGPWSWLESPKAKVIQISDNTIRTHNILEQPSSSNTANVFTVIYIKLNSTIAIRPKKPYILSAWFWEMQIENEGGDTVCN